jgi:histone H2B
MAPPKPAEKKPAAAKAPAKKPEGPKDAKKKRTKSRKETYSSYIYKGSGHPIPVTFEVLTNMNDQCSSKSTRTRVSRTALCPSSTHLSMVCPHRQSTTLDDVLNIIQISLSALLRKRRSLLLTTRSRPSHPVRFKRRMWISAE